MQRARVTRVSAIALAVIVTTFCLIACTVVTARDAAASGSVPTAAVAVASGTVVYSPPCDAPIVDHFRPPKGEWGPGNRGSDYGTTAGAEISAVAEGAVVFAGEVGGALHVTIEHTDGLRSSYSFLATIAVARGDRVRRGASVGTAAGPFHLGFRTPDGSYLDPEAVLSGAEQPSTRLVPGADEGLAPLGGGEHRSLMHVLFDTGSAAIANLARTGVDIAAIGAHYATTLSAVAVEFRAATAFVRWAQQRMNCTDESVPVPSPTARRIVIEVSGLGTASDDNSAWEFDTDRLGYAPDDVVRFSYNGGRVPPRRPGISALEASGSGWSEFDRIDSQQPVGVSADRLAALISATARDNPGVPIDVFAHSQGGVVARLAVERADRAGDLPSSVSTLVTVGSPHAGAPLATGVAAVGLTAAGRGVLGAVRSSHLAGDLDDRLPAMADLAETSPVIQELRSTPMPQHVRFVSLGGSGDLVVPGVATSDPAADDQRILPTELDLAVHGHLPGDSRVTRELGLAVAGLPLTCQGFTEAAGSFLMAEGVSVAESAAGAGIAVGVVGGSPPLAAIGAGVGALVDDD
ncbi:MAG: peptidoglycan DD-metalloendopeptidase family protein [Actinobacteria bacterium]|uniref:Unannotated protein n=1 Tax=freshwater metagenome TaxID=449393 RepID=A0A6J5YDT6_9ZZZZ|nr:peptidoglycan DD-metalloendopeptidase family protein [Actinomycetota bacterium]